MNFDNATQAARIKPCVCGSVTKNRIGMICPADITIHVFVHIVIVTVQLFSGEFVSNSKH